MKTIHFNVILKSIFIAFILTVLAGCNKETDEPVIGGDHLPSEEIKKQAFLGVTVPFLIQDEGDGKYTIGLSPHARPFAFNEKVLLGGTVFLNLLRSSKETNVPVRVYIYPNSNYIWWVEEATEEDITNYRVAEQKPEN